MTGKIMMDKNSFINEHKHLIKMLRAMPMRSKLLKEASKQANELRKRK